MTEETPAGTGQLSPDGYWWWNGSQWVSAVSADGRWRWDGEKWVVNDVGTRLIGPVNYEPTPDTRRIQIAVTIYLLLSYAYTVVVIPQSMAASMKASLQAAPAYDPSLLNGLVTGITVGTLVAGVIWGGVLIFGTWSTWRWVYYLLMILGGFSALSVLSNGAALAGVGTSAILPAWVLSLGIVFAVINFGLALWMFMLWRRYKSAWARRAVPA